MNRQAWLRRLDEQLPGWSVWYAGAGGAPGSSGWFAVPAPADVPRAERYRLPHRLGPYPTPQELRTAARERYGWDDHCETCGDRWQKCGHRAPETKDRSA